MYTDCLEFIINSLNILYNHLKKKTTERINYILYNTNNKYKLYNKYKVLTITYMKLH